MKSFEDSDPNDTLALLSIFSSKPMIHCNLRVMQPSCALLQLCLLSALLAGLFACTSSPENGSSCPPYVYEPPNTTIERVNFFLEMSGSMRGFMPETEVTAFQRNVDDLAVEIDNSSHVEQPAYFALKESIDSVGRGTFEKVLRSGLTRAESAANSDLPAHLRAILEQYAYDNTVSLLASEFIYAPPNNRNVEFVKSEFKRVFNQAARKDMALSVYAFTSDFQGTYWPAGIKSPISNCCDTVIPYYIWAIGDQESLTAFGNEVLKNDYEAMVNYGFQYEAPFYGILPRSGRAGEWYCLDNCACKAVYEVGTDKDWGDTPPTISIGLNLAHLSAYYTDPDYLSEHLTVSPSTGCKAEIYQVLTINSFENERTDARDASLLKSFTHVVKVQVDQLTENAQLTLALDDVLPTWIQDWSTPDDSNINQVGPKTFALVQMLEGIDEAYAESSRADIFSISVDLNIRENQ